MHDYGGTKQQETTLTNPVAIEEVAVSRDRSVCKVCMGWGRKQAFICSACGGAGVVKLRGGR